MRIMVLGGDGYCGWATALHLSVRAHEVTIVDSLVRHDWDHELGIGSLTETLPLPSRVEAWNEMKQFGAPVRFYINDVTDAAGIASLIKELQPEAVIHFAEQKAAPYSMIDLAHAVYTHQNNLVGTLNLIYALRDFAPECHLVKLGTMGEYGTPNIDIEEGWLTVDYRGRSDRLLYPKRPGSWYHATKCHDSLNIEFACRIWGLRATDLNQGVVYGLRTPETDLRPELMNRFDYDAIFGTVLNRFIVQAAAHEPITPYGKGGQTRGFLDIRDTVRCIELACAFPARPGEFRVFNQFTEQFSVERLAERVRRVAEAMGLSPRVVHLEDPRVEAEVHYYNATHTKLESLGLEPHLLNDETIADLIAVALENKVRIDHTVFEPRVNWRASRNPVRADGEVSA